MSMKLFIILNIVLMSIFTASVTALILLEFV